MTHKFFDRTSATLILMIVSVFGILLWMGADMRREIRELQLPEVRLELRYLVQIIAISPDPLNPLVPRTDTCSGTVVKNTMDGYSIILTAKHCTGTAQTVQVLWHGNNGADPATEMEGEVVRTLQTREDAPSGLALVRVARVLPSATLLFEMPRIGEMTWALGYPLGKRAPVTDGYGGALDDELANLIYSTTPVTFGNSGGPLVVYRRDCRCYRVIAVVEAVPSVRIGDIFIPASSLSFSTPIATEFVANFLLKHGVIDHLPEGIPPGEPPENK